MDLAHVDRVLVESIHQGTAPGACYAVGTSEMVFVKTFGRHTYSEDSTAVKANTIWDLASLTKVLGTTTAAMLLVESKELDIDRPVCDFIPEFAQNGKSEVTVGNLLLHDSGLPASHPSPTSRTDPVQLLCDVWAQSPVYVRGENTIYSDLGFIALAKVIEAVAGKTLDLLLQSRVFLPLGMEDTSFAPALAERHRCAPTEAVEPWRAELRRMRGLDTPEIREIEKRPDGRSWITGEVHDPTAMVLGGTAGHAGMFSTAPDVARLMQVMLSPGGGLIPPATVRRFTSRTNPKSSRALGWDTPSEGSSAGKNLSRRSFGHTGFTGTSAWADPDRGIFAVLLTNRVHPTADNQRIRELRVAFHDAVHEALSAER